jgi:hypothetical protein
MDITRYPLELLDFCIVCQFYITFPCIYYHRPEHKALLHRNHAYVGASYDSYSVSRQHLKEHTKYRFSYKDFLLLDIQQTLV